MNLRDKLAHPIFELITQVQEESKIPIYCVGGYVRDLIIGRPSKDIDFVVVGDGCEIAEKLAHKIENKPQVHVFKNFGTAQIKTEDGWDIEFVGARKESYVRTSRKPTVEPGSLEDDQKRRDFTINALALDMSKAHFGELIDPFNGLEHLKEKLLITPLDPEITFSDDPLRMLRAIRFSTQLNFKIDLKTFESIKNTSERLKIVSAERITDELNKIILAPTPSIGFKLLDQCGILEMIFPEFLLLKGVEIIDGKGHKDNFYHTLQVLDNISKDTDDLWLRWSAILHDIAKPQTKKFEPGHGWTFHGHEDKGARMVPKIFRNLRLPLNEKMKFVQKMVALHLRPIVLAQRVVTDSAIRRLIVEAGDDVYDLLTLCKADITSKNEQKVKKYLNNLEIVKQKIQDVSTKDELRNWQPPITGNHIMEAFELDSPQQIGILKNKVREAILEGEIPDELEPAYAYLIEKGQELGLKLKK